MPKMLLEKTPKEFRAIFLSNFIQEIILNYRNKDIIFLEKIARDKINRKLGKYKNEEELHKFVKAKKISLPVTQEIQPIPKPLQNTFYQPTEIQEHKFGKIDGFVKDPTILSIECEGPEKNVIIRTTNGNKVTGLILNQLEIVEIIENFSNISNIPAEEGAYKVVVDNLSFSAILSEVVEPRFLIVKLQR